MYCMIIYAMDTYTYADSHIHACMPTLLHTYVHVYIYIYIYINMCVMCGYTIYICVYHSMSSLHSSQQHSRFMCDGLAFDITWLILLG